MEGCGASGVKRGPMSRERCADYGQDKRSTGPLLNGAQSAGCPIHWPAPCCYNFINYPTITPRGRRGRKDRRDGERVKGERAEPVAEHTVIGGFRRRVQMSASRLHGPK